MNHLVLFIYQNYTVLFEETGKITRKLSYTGFKRKQKIRLKDAFCFCLSINSLERMGKAMNIILFIVHDKKPALKLHD